MTPSGPNGAALAGTPPARAARGHVARVLGGPDTRRPSGTGAGGTAGGRSATRRRGQALAEYLAVVAVIAALMLTLTALRSQRAGRVPIDPVRSVGALIAPPPVVRAPRTVPARPRPPRARTAPRRPRAPDRRPLITGPRWALGP